MTVFLILIIFYSTFLDSNTENWVGWLVLSLSVVLGLGVGFLFTKIARFAAAILSGWGGFLLGVIINESWLYMYGSSALFWIVNIAMAIIFTILGFVLFVQAIIISTASMGGYFICRGISFWAGGFPSAFFLVQQV
jgi:cytochrome b